MQDAEVKIPDEKISDLQRRLEGDSRIDVPDMIKIPLDGDDKGNPIKYGIVGKIFTFFRRL